MTTKLNGEIKRELLVGKQAYTLTISPTGFGLALKGRRKGLDIKWIDLVSGEAALATALNASLTANIQSPVLQAPGGAAERKNPSRARYRDEKSTPGSPSTTARSPRRSRARK